MIKMVVVFVVLFVAILFAQSFWSTLNSKERSLARRMILKSAGVASIVTVILSIITILF